MYEKVLKTKFATILILVSGLLFAGTYTTYAQEASTTPPASGGLLRDGIFGCTASKYANVGSTVAIGGVYVPVNDAAVTLNTGYLVYKECVLDGVIAKIGEAARTDLVRTTLRRLNDGRNGQPLWPQNRLKELGERADKVVRVAVDDATTGVMCSVFKNQVRTQYLRQYLANKNTPNNVFACSYSSDAGDQQAALDGTIGEDDVLEALGNLSRPGNDPYSAQLLYTEFIEGAISTAVNDQEERWRINNGFYDVTDNSNNPFEEKVVTPGFLVSQGAEQAYTAGFRCVEGADELSEVCAPLFSAMVPESFNNGLINMTRAASGLASYVNRMVSDAAAAVRGEAVNAAITILRTAREFELAYKQSKDTSAQKLEGAINRLKTMEKSCWNLILNNPNGPHVCASPPDANGTCFTQEVCVERPATGIGGGTTRTCTPGIELKVATSTQFSQAVINTQIAPLAIVVAGDIQKSAAALVELNRLIGDVTNSASAANQSAALSKLDQMVAPNALLPDCSPQKTLHSGADVECAKKQRDDITTATDLLIDSTAQRWGASDNVDVGWCNVNNPAVITKWTDEWKK